MVAQIGSILAGWLYPTHQACGWTPWQELKLDVLSFRSVSVSIPLTVHYRKQQCVRRWRWWWIRPSDCSHHQFVINADPLNLPDRCEFIPPVITWDGPLMDTPKRKLRALLATYRQRMRYPSHKM